MTRLERLGRRAARSRLEPRLERTARVLAALLVVVGGLDLISTNAALAAGHLEGNSLVAAFQAELGSWWSVPKIAFHLILAWFVLWLPSKRMLKIAGLVIAGYAVIGANNFYLVGMAV